MKHQAVLAVALVTLAGCSDGPTGPLFIDEEVIADLDTSLPRTGLIAFNDAGQALWSEDRQAYLWDGSEVHALPFEGIDLGPDGAVVGVEGPFFYWRDGEITEIPEAFGFDGQGRVYVRIDHDDFRWWTPEGTSPAPRGLTGLSRGVVAVGDDGSILYWNLEGEPRAHEYAYYHSTLEEEVEVGRTTFPYSGSDITDSGLLYLTNGATTRVINTRSWTEKTFDFGAFDMNDESIFVTDEGEVVDAAGEVFGTVEAVNALINDRNAILTMAPDGVVTIIR